MSNSFFFQAEDGIRDIGVTGVQTCALPILDGDEELSPRPRPAGGVAGVHLQRANPIHSYRQRDLQNGSGRLPDADQKPAAAAGPAIFQATEEVTSGWLLPAFDEKPGRAPNAVSKLDRRRGAGSVTGRDDSWRRACV